MTVFAVPCSPISKTAYQGKHQYEFLKNRNISHLPLLSIDQHISPYLHKIRVMPSKALLKIPKLCADIIKIYMSTINSSIYLLRKWFEIEHQYQDWNMHKISKNQQYKMDDISCHWSGKWKLTYLFISKSSLSFKIQKTNFLGYPYATRQ